MAAGDRLALSTAFRHAANKITDLSDAANPHADKLKPKKGDKAKPTNASTSAAENAALVEKAARAAVNNFPHQVNSRFAAPLGRVAPANQKSPPSSSGADVPASGLSSRQSKRKRIQSASTTTPASSAPLSIDGSPIQRFNAAYSAEDLVPDFKPIPHSSQAPFIKILQPIDIAQADLENELILVIAPLREAAIDDERKGIDAITKVVHAVLRDSCTGSPSQKQEQLDDLLK